MQIKYGMDRIVILIGNYAIKFPRYNDDQSFVRGMLSNILESVRWNRTKHNTLAPVIYKAPFGIMLIMQRAIPLQRMLRVEEIAQIPYSNIDNNGENAGIIAGRVVLYDYGHPDMKYLG